MARPLLVGPVLARPYLGIDLHRCPGPRKISKAQTGGRQDVAIALARFCARESDPYSCCGVDWRGDSSRLEGYLPICGTDLHEPLQPPPGRSVAQAVERSD